MFDSSLPRKPIVSITLGQAIEKLALNKDLVTTQGPELVSFYCITLT